MITKTKHDDDNGSEDDDERQDDMGIMVCDRDTTDKESLRRKNLLNAPHTIDISILIIIIIIIIIVTLISITIINTIILIIIMYNAPHTKTSQSSEYQC